ncbi:hypothetical protein ACTZWW_12905 [Salinarimonas sp. NSM]|uniref:hypothetical protein n=1 Tax=Salinarimonas sp. NSM TaxID=3458003 RepID=UPI0040354A1A
MKDDEINPWELLAIARASMRPVQGHWTWRSSRLGPGQEKSVEEIANASAVLEAVGFDVGNVRAGNDPPDCEALIDGELWSIEVTELVESRWLSSAMKDYRLLKPLPESFHWTRDALLTRLQERISVQDQKSRKYAHLYLRRALVIVTAEEDLHAHAVEKFLHGAVFYAERITDVLFGLDYHPSPDGDGKSPVFRLKINKP